MPTAEWGMSHPPPSQGVGRSEGPKDGRPKGKPPLETKRAQQKQRRVQYLERGLEPREALCAPMMAIKTEMRFISKSWLQ